MTDRIFAGASVVMTSLAALTGVTRLWPTPSGRHRAKRPLLLPDVPLAEQTQPIRHAVLDENQLTQMLEADEVAVNECADCPACGRTTFHAMHRDGSRRCWTCATWTPAGEA
ncbi:hypothetical protein [Streptomyces sp. NPDC060001]|uniref:hypothetical protein n=1 Tax=Streptomyces sp. NPDC060001 TaxID=3347032 RepID=UPI0036801852